MTIPAGNIRGGQASSSTSLSHNDDHHHAAAIEAAVAAAAAASKAAAAATTAAAAAIAAAAAAGGSPAAATGGTINEQYVHAEMQKKNWELIAIYRGDDTDVLDLPAAKDPTVIRDNKWASQGRQDRTIVDLFDGKKGGYFIDLAAHAPVFMSNTMTLDRFYEWSGLCIEANPVANDAFTSRRCQLVRAVVGAETNESMTFDFSGGK